MIERIRLLRGIGQFDCVDAGKNMPLSHFTAIYAENGRGKTTLTAVLRSLRTGNSLPIGERARLGAQHPPHVVLTCCGPQTPVVFNQNAWNCAPVDMEIFDDIFINENVHSSLAVESAHRQKLYELILGEQAVKLNTRLKSFVDNIAEHNKILNGIKNAIPQSQMGPHTIDQFCALSPQSNIDQAIQEAERALAAAQEQSAIQETSPFEFLRLPRFNLSAIEKTLRQDLPALENAALNRVRAHFDALEDGGEAWVAEGMNRIPRKYGDSSGFSCPFCAQDLTGSPLIQHYQAYFGTAYKELKDAVAKELAEIQYTHGEGATSGFERSVRIAIERRQFWSRFCAVTEFNVDTAAVVRDWTAARRAVVSHLVTKQTAPLERIEISEEPRLLVNAHDVHRSTIEQINRTLRETNQAIEITKKTSTQSTPKNLNATLACLIAKKARYEPQIARLCGEYLQESERKKLSKRERDQARESLEHHRTTVFPKFQQDINSYLEKFNAGFLLDSLEYTNIGGGSGSTCTYNVLINNTPVAIGKVAVTPDQPAFRNTLSAGDRTTLALAFFFATLDHHADLSKVIVVLDDPISSLDHHRVVATNHEINRLAQKARQVIVLSHNKSFLSHLWDSMAQYQRAAVEVCRSSSGSTLREWDPLAELTTEHDRRAARFRNFIADGSGDRSRIAGDIRHHLERFLRVAFPQHCKSGTKLGEFIDICKNAAGTPDRILEMWDFEELEALYDFQWRPHHDESYQDSISDQQLLGFVKRTLNFTRK